MRSLFFFLFLGLGNIEAIDPERVLLDLKELATVEFWENQDHIRCLVKALQADRNAVTPRMSFEITALCNKPNKFINNVTLFVI